MILTVDNLSFAYPQGPPALDNVSLSAGAGDRIGIVGPNGAGKTTLFLCLSGVLKRRSGAVQVAGLDPMDRAQRRQVPSKLGIVFQNPDDQLFNSTVRDDVAFGPLNLELPHEEVRRRVAEALARVGLDGMEDRAPLNLSSGEKRRVALAGVLAMHPQIILFDEPSSDLDPRGRRELIRLLQSLNDVTQIIASHDLEMIVETCARCVLLDQGAVVAEDVTRTLLSNRELMESHGLAVPSSLERT